MQPTGSHSLIAFTLCIHIFFSSFDLLQVLLPILHELLPTLEVRPVVLSAVAQGLSQESSESLLIQSIEWGVRAGDLGERLHRFVSVWRRSPVDASKNVTRP